MQVYVFSQSQRGLKLINSAHCAIGVCERIAQGYSTDDLFVFLYLTDGSTVWHGLYEHNTHRAGVAPTKRDWFFANQFHVPLDLPVRFPLIRIELGTLARYPKTVTSAYGWNIHVHSIQDHLADVFAHEFCHHLQHRADGISKRTERETDAWALGRAAQVGFSVTGKYTGRSKRPSNSSQQVEIRKPEVLARAREIMMGLCAEDIAALSAWLKKVEVARRSAEKRRKALEHAKALREMHNGKYLLLRGNVPTRYAGKPVRKVANEPNSTKIVVLTPNHVQLAFPPEWLKPMKPARRKRAACKCKGICPPPEPSEPALWCPVRNGPGSGGPS